MAVAATIYLGWLGPAGLAELGRQCASKAAYTAERLTAIDGVDLLHPGAPFFKEFAVTTAAAGDRGARRARRARVPGGRAARRCRRPRARRRGHREADRATRSTGSRRRSRRCSRDRRADPPAGSRRRERARSRTGRGRAGRAFGFAPLDVPEASIPDERSAPDRARAARGVRDRPGAPLHAAVADELRRGHGLLPAGLVHDEVQPEGRRDRRRAAGVPADAPVAARRRRPRVRSRCSGGSSRRSARSPGWRAPRSSRPPARAAR